MFVSEPGSRNPTPFAATLKTADKSCRPSINLMRGVKNKYFDNASSEAPAEWAKRKTNLFLHQNVIYVIIVGHFDKLASLNLSKTFN